MAGTQKVKLMAKGLLNCGFRATVLCTQVSEWPSSVENREPGGVIDGIPFEYTTGTTIRSDHFFVRRWVELRGILGAVLRLADFKRQKQACCIFYYGRGYTNSIAQWIFLIAARLLHIPFILDVCERPWTMAENKPFWDRISPLRGPQGAIVISDFLRYWAEQEKKRINPGLAIFELPILVDVNEQAVKPYSSKAPEVLFAGSPVYDQTVQFLLDAMQVVWKIYPQCTLTITGCRPEDPAGKALVHLVKNYHIEAPVEMAGYLSRQDLLRRYGQATALLIPLFDDTRSKARFPIKLGEYLASGRPVVTTNVGEAARFFVDNHNSYLSAPGDVTGYGQKILEVLENREEAEVVGRAGRKLAEENFHYLVHSSRLAEFFGSFCR